MRVSKAMWIEGNVGRACCCLARTPEAAMKISIGIGRAGILWIRGSWNWEGGHSRERSSEWAEFWERTESELHLVRTENRGETGKGTVSCGKQIQTGRSLWAAGKWGKGRSEPESSLNGSWKFSKNDSKLGGKLQKTRWIEMESNWARKAYESDSLFELVINLLN
jgi:hypothetical protein